MKTFFWADPHLSHDGILGITFRDFPDIDTHNEVVLEELNSRVGVNDRIIVCGDVCWRAEEMWMSKIRCKNRYLIIGNHDKAKLGKLFSTVEDVAEFKILGHKVFASHYPHAYWPASHHGSCHVYGHTHAQREATLDKAFPGRRAIDVGVDNAFRLFGKYRPFTEDEVIEILMSRPGHDFVAYYDGMQEERKRVGVQEFNRLHMNEPWVMPPSEWVLDHRVGCIAVYRGPKRECLDGGEFLFYKQSHYSEDFGWRLADTDIAEANRIFKYVAGKPKRDG